MHEWYGESGDSVNMPNWPHGPVLEQREILRRVAAAFRRVVIDWDEGDQWVEVRIAKAVESGYSGFLLEAEHDLRSRTVLVSFADAAGSGEAWVRFYMTQDTSGFELHYDPAGAVSACRALARKLAEVLGYEFAAWEEGEAAEPGAAADGAAQ
jgi:hypothetical protein